MKVLITLGPTQEPIDAIRYITNASSGRMGLAISKEAIKRKISTTIIAGPVSLVLPKKAKIFHVVTAEEMIKKTLAELKMWAYDIFISTAAIADFSPEKNFFSGKKIKSREELTIKLKQNPKLTRLVREKFQNLFIVGFKAEYDIPREKLVKKAFNKLIEDNLNLVVANDLKVSKFGSEKSEVFIVSKDSVEHIPKTKKELIAKKIWERILEMKKVKKTA